MKIEYNIQKDAVAKRMFIEKIVLFATISYVILSYIERNAKSRKSNFKFYADVIF